SERLQSIEQGLARWRNIQPLYVDQPQMLKEKKDKVHMHLCQIGLTDDEADFVESKVRFDVGYADLSNDGLAQNMFVAQLLTHPQLRSINSRTASAAYTQLFRILHVRKGSAIYRTQLERVLQDSVMTRVVENLTVHFHSYLISYVFL